MEHTIEENVTVKREVNKFMNRFFYSKEKNKENLAKMYFYLDDFARYINDLQLQIGNELLTFEDFDTVFLEQENIKVFLDEELCSILIDSITAKEKNTLLKQQNENYVKALHDKQFNK